MTRLSAEEQAFLREAVLHLEHPSLLVRLTDLVGRPIEGVARRLPRRARSALSRAVDRSLRAALDVAVTSLDAGAARQGSVANVASATRTAQRGHVALTMATGALGGAFGWAGLAVELPITTTLILRSIALTARDFGEPLGDPAVRLECLAVLSHGSPSPGDDALDSSYLATRTALAATIQQAAAYAATRTAAEIQRALAEGTAPALLRLVASVAARFEVVVSEKALAEAVPVVGAVGGAVINAAFAAHFAGVARYHFGIRRLERIHGEVVVHEAYRALLPAAAGLPALRESAPPKS